MKKVLAAVTLATIIGLTGLTQASAGWGPGSMGGGSFHPGMQVRAQLDDATKKKFDKFMEETQDLRRQMAVKRAESRAMMRAKEPNASEVGKVAGELFDLRSTMRAKAKEAGLAEVMGAGKHGDCRGSGFHSGRRSFRDRQGASAAE